jgi:hypothetical protein
MRDEQRRVGVDQSRSEALTGIIGARRVPGLDVLAAVDALQVDAGDAEVAVSELALDDDQWHAFARHLDSVGVAELMRREAASHSCRGGDAPQLGACRGYR